MSLRHEDLKATILPRISIDEFAPKSGTSREIIVVGLYAMDQEPANDLNTFIQRGSFDMVDSEVSPNPDENGNYLIFVEFDRNPEFTELLPKFITDIENITGKQDWMIKAYLAPEAYAINDPQLPQYIITEPGKYQNKTDIKQTADVKESFKDALLKGLTVIEGYVIFTDGTQAIAANLIDYGQTEEISLKHKLSSVPIIFGSSTELNTLGAMLGEAWVVHDMDKIVALENERGELFLMNDVQYAYGSARDII